MTFTKNIHSVNAPHTLDILSFLDCISLLKLSIKQANSLDLPLTTEDLKKALFSMPNNKV